MSRTLKLNSIVIEKGKQCDTFVELEYNKHTLTYNTDLYAGRSGDVLDTLIDFFASSCNTVTTPTSTITSLQELKSYQSSQKTGLISPTFQYKTIQFSIPFIVLENDTIMVYEIKPTSTIKPGHFKDAGLKRYLLSLIGIPITHHYLSSINKYFKKKGPVTPESFFYTKRLPEDISHLLPANKELIKKLLSPKYNTQPKLGKHCHKPRPCPFLAQCWQGIQNEDSIFNLKGYPLHDKIDHFKNNIKTFDQIEPGSLNDHQSNQTRTYKTDAPHIDIPYIQKFLAQISYPIISLDFEASHPVIPLYDGCKPFDDIPFLYSIHKLDSPTSPIQNTLFFPDSKEDPRKEFITSLLKDIPEKGSILTYSKEYEIQTLTRFSRKYPELAHKINDIKSRIIDLMTPFKHHAYYTKNMQGSHSLKSVLPSIYPDLSFDSLSISNGEELTKAWEHYLYDTRSELDPKLKEKLITYCQMDTIGIIKLFQFLTGLIKKLD